MLSSARAPDWTEFSLRDEVAGLEFGSPVAEVAAMARLQASVLAAAAGEAAQANSRLLIALAEQAVLAVQLGAALGGYESELANASLARVHRHLRVVKDQMLAGLKTVDLEVVVPTGLSYAEVADAVEVIGWRHGAEFVGEVVAEAVEPIVRHAGQLLRPGRVYMGAPLPSPDQPGGDPDTKNASATS